MLYYFSQFKQNKSDYCQGYLMINQSSVISYFIVVVWTLKDFYICNYLIFRLSL